MQTKAQMNREQWENNYHSLGLSPQWTFCHTPKALHNCSTIPLDVSSGVRGVSDLASWGLEDCDLGELA